MTRAFLLLLRGEPQEALLTECEFEKLITAQSVGPLILNYVFATGFKSAFSLALTSKRLWVILAGSVNYFDFYAGRLQNLGPSGVFVSVTPEFTLQEMMATRLTDPYGFKAATPFTDWHNAAITREEDAVNTLFMVRQRLRAEAKKSKNGPQQPIPAFLDAIFNQSTLRAILALKDIDAIFKANQFVSLPADSIFEPQMIYAATRLQLLREYYLLLLLIFLFPLIFIILFFLLFPFLSFFPISLLFSYFSSFFLFLFFSYFSFFFPILFFFPFFLLLSNFRYFPLFSY